MNASYNAQLCNGENKYTLQFESDDYALFKEVERACRKAVDKAEKANSKARAAEMARFGHL